MSDENEPLREMVDRSGYAFNMAVADSIRRSRDRQCWRVEAEEIPWSLMKQSGYIDLAISRDSAIGIMECKKVNQNERLVFLVRQDQGTNVIRCQLEVYVRDLPERESHELPGMRVIRMQSECRFILAECQMPSGSAESSYCVAPKGKPFANLDLDGIASDLLDSCEGLLGDWDFKLPGQITACIPIIVTNATLYTCAFDPAQVDLASADLPPTAAFQQQPFLRFRKAFRHSGGRLALDTKDTLAQVVAQGERTVFVVDARHLVPFLAGLRGLMFPLPGGSGERQLVST